jgi:hypothetical protein
MTGGEAGKLLNRFFSKSILITKVTQEVIKRAVTLSLSSTSYKISLENIKEFL